jgi:hypothetical protein
MFYSIIRDNNKDLIENFIRFLNQEEIQIFLDCAKLIRPNLFDEIPKLSIYNLFS